MDGNTRGACAGAAALLLLAPLAAVAGSETYFASLRYSAPPAAGRSPLFDYTSIEGSLLLRDDRDHSRGGASIAGSLGLRPQLALTAEYERFPGLGEATAGVLFHTPLVERLDGFAGAGIEHLDEHDESHLGLRLRGGLRWLAIPARLELQPELSYGRIERRDRTTFGVTALLKLVERLDLEAGVAVGDQSSFALGLRYVFGPGYTFR